MTVSAVLILLVLILIPAFAYVILRNGVAAFVVSAPLGMLALVARMVYLEANAPRGELDIVFVIACLLWASILTTMYAACFLGAYIVRRIFVD